MTGFIEFKEMEGARIQPLLGAVAALPAAALVLGKDSTAGAPLFLAALGFVAVAYIMWMCADSVFYLHYLHDHAENPAEGRRLDRVGYYLSWCTYGYGAVSIITAGLGVAGMHSSLRTPLSVETGFVIALVFIVAAAVHGAHAVHIRNVQEELGEATQPD